MAQMSPSQIKTSNVRIYDSTDKDLPEVARNVLDVLSSEVVEEDKESLHSIFKRKGFTCFCTKCYEAKYIIKV